MNMDDYEVECAKEWGELSSAAREVLRCLCRHGPTYDGDVPSKSGRDELIIKQLAAKIVMGDQWIGSRQGKRPRPVAEEGYQAATYRGRTVWRVGEVEPKKEIVRKLVGDASLVRDRP